MPFTGEIDNEVVWPDDVEDGTSVTCLNCGDQMHVRRSHITEDGILKPRCFVHNPDASVGGMCPGGESEEHKLMKYVVSRRMRRMFDHGTIERERAIPETNRIADVVINFDEPFRKFGRGVVAEVQYRHKDKDIESVTNEYLQSGYSIYWINEEHFSNDYQVVDLPDLITAWPNSVPPLPNWSGVSSAVEELSECGSRYPIEAKFPPDFVRDHKDTLENFWRIGAENYNFDLVYLLSENNASRPCSVCGEEATVYLFQDGVVSTFRCDEHTIRDNTGPNELVPTSTALGGDDE